ncbi:MAG TPA: hypothetical protein PLX06_08325 [Fimbriimonadaceae bacterium]|nr:hypothetical protein [Fimbriimonadaceae bacterium]
MSEKNRRFALIGALALAGAALAFVLLTRQDEAEIPKTSNGIYYTGPMKSKNPAKSGVYGNVDGSQMTAEEAKAAAQKWEQENLGKVN